MRLGLVLGGGGVVGIAWEIGVLAGLQRAGALRPEAVETLVGTSAGSMVAARLALGHDLDDMVEEQRAAPPAAGSGGNASRTTDLSAVMEIFGELRAAEEVTTAVTRVVGQKAMAASTAPEDRWVASFEATLGAAGGWPQGRDLRIAALSCTSGERRMWTAADAAVAPLAHAVASSCAVPGMFPPVTIDGDRYTDGGVWSSSNVDVLVADGLDAVLFVGPTSGGDAAAPGRRPALDVEAEQLVAAGTRFDRIVPGPAFATEIGLVNLMNPAFRIAGVDIGLQDGAAAAGAVRRLSSPA